MKLGIIGLPKSGRSTIFGALSGARGEASKKDRRIITVKVMDDRVDFLSAMYKPKKTTYSQIEYLLPSDPVSGSEGVIWNLARTCDGLIHVVRNFTNAASAVPEPEEDLKRLEQDMILSDLEVVEKRIERIEKDIKKGKKSEEEEYSLLKSCVEILEGGRPLRISPSLTASPLLKGFTLLSAKPQLVIINNDDEDESMPRWKSVPENVEMCVIRGRIQMEIAAMPEEDAEEFVIEYHIEKSALDRLIGMSYKLLNLISFFTVSEDEVRAWTVSEGTPALEAAGEVHTDMQQGFIRAEVLSYYDLKKYESFREARGAGRVRLEGKEYVVQDGDIINFRFNI
jgi:GTP-binding protein YchF